MSGSTGGKESGWTRVIRKGKQQGWKLSKPPQMPALEFNNQASSNTSHGSPGSSYMTCKSNFSAGSLTGQLSVNVEGRKGSVSAPGTPSSKQSALSCEFESRAKLHLDDMEAWPQIKAFYPQHVTDSQIQHMPEHAPVSMSGNAARRPQSARHPSNTQAERGRALPNTSVWGAPHRLQNAVSQNELQQQQQQQQEQQEQQQQENETEHQEPSSHYPDDEQQQSTEGLSQADPGTTPATQVCDSGNAGDASKPVQPVDQHVSVNQPLPSQAKFIVHAASNDDIQPSLELDVVQLTVVPDDNARMAITGPSLTTHATTPSDDTTQPQETSKSEETMQDLLHPVDSWGSFTESADRSSADIGSLPEQSSISMTAAVQPAGSYPATDSSLTQQAVARHHASDTESTQTVMSQPDITVNALPQAPTNPDATVTNSMEREPTHAVGRSSKQITSNVSLTSATPAKVVVPSVIQQHPIPAAKSGPAAVSNSSAVMQQHGGKRLDSSSTQVQQAQSKIRADAPVFTLKESTVPKHDARLPAAASAASKGVSPDSCASKTATSNSTANSSSTSSPIIHVSTLQQMHHKKSVPSTYTAMQAPRANTSVSVPALTRRLSVDGTSLKADARNADNSTRHVSKTSSVSLHLPAYRPPPTFDTVTYLTEKCSRVRRWPLPQLCQVPAASLQDRACCAICRLCPALPPICKPTSTLASMT